MLVAAKILFELAIGFEIGSTGAMLGKSDVAVAELSVAVSTWDFDEAALTPAAVTGCCAKGLGASEVGAVMRENKLPELS